jgi:hypothetical protein
MNVGRLTLAGGQAPTAVRVSIRSDRNGSNLAARNRGGERGRAKLRGPELTFMGTRGAVERQGPGRQSRLTPARRSEDRGLRGAAPRSARAARLLGMGDGRKLPSRLRLSCACDRGDRIAEAAAGIRGGGKSIPVLTRALRSGTDAGLGPACAAGPTSYSSCPGAITMQGCWLAANLAQAAFAALADRLLRRARYTTLPPKGEVGGSSI